MRKWIVLCCFLISISGSFAQQLSIKEYQTAQALEFVTLMSQEPQAYAISDSAGQVDITKFKGAENVEFRLIGYQGITKSYEELQEKGFVLYLKPTQFSLNQVVVSATRWNQSQGSVPARVSTIPTKDIFLQNPQTAADLLGSSGEVFIQKSQQGGGSPMIRGFSANRLLYTIDGVRMNTAIFRSGNLQNVISLDPFSLENTEILFGPGAVIYGSDAIGAVMAFQTLKPQLSLKSKPSISGNTLIRYATANQEKTIHSDINFGWNKWALITSFSHNNYGDLKMGKYGPEEYLRPFYVETQNGQDLIINNENPRIQTPNGYSQINLMQKIRFRPSKKWDLQYGFHFSNTNNIPRFDRLIRLRNDLPGSAEWEYGPQKWLMNNLNITHNQVHHFYDQMSIRLAHQFFEESRIDRDFQDPERRIREENVNAFSANIDFIKSLNLKAKFYYGLEAIYNEVQSRGLIENIEAGSIEAGPARYPLSSWYSYAAYGVYQQDLSSHINFQIGLRFNQFGLDADFRNNLDFYPFPNSQASINKGALTGSLGVIYRPTEDWSISTLFSTGFRAPNVDDIGKVFDSEPGSVVIPNPNLNAEFAYNFEANLSRIFGSGMKLDFTVYHTTLDNALVRRNYQLNGQDSIIYAGELSRVQAIQNAAKARIYGFQTGFEIKFSRSLRLISRLNIQVGEEELDDGSQSPSRHAAPWYGLTRLTYSNKKLEAQVYLNYSGSRSHEDLPLEERGKVFLYAQDENGLPFSPGWITTNLKTSYHWTDSFSINIGLENITNRRYRPYSSGIVAPGRNLVVSGKMRF